MKESLVDIQFMSNYKCKWKYIALEIDIKWNDIFHLLHFPFFKLK